MNAGTKELKHRVEAKRKRVEARIHELKADASDAASKQADKLQKELNEVRSAVSDGYEHLKKESIHRLNEWIKD